MSDRALPDPVDIHANIDALDAVLDAPPATWDRVLVLGDLVGYGAEPNAVIDRVRALDPGGDPRQSRQGGLRARRRLATSTTWRRFAAAWTHAAADAREPRVPAAAAARARSRSTTRSRSATARRSTRTTTSSTASTPQRALDTASRQVCLFGHTHLPVVFMAKASALAADIPDDELQTLPFEDGTRYLINPGSVGQPRDGDARAAFAFYETSGRMDFSARRVPRRRRAEADLGGGAAAEPGESARDWEMMRARSTPKSSVQLQGTARSPGESAAKLAIDFASVRILPWELESAFGVARACSARAAVPRAASARSRSASCAARDPRIQPMTTPTSSTPGMKMKCAAVMSPMAVLPSGDGGRRCCTRRLTSASSCSTRPCAARSRTDSRRPPPRRPSTRR